MEVVAPPSSSKTHHGDGETTGGGSEDTVMERINDDNDNDNKKNHRGSPLPDVLVKPPFADIVMHHVLDLLEPADILHLMQIPKCRLGWHLKQSHCSVDGSKFRLHDNTMTKMERDETRHIFQSNVQNAKDAGQSHKDHDLPHFLIRSNKERVCPHCHACLGCRTVFHWQERQHLDPVYCEDCPGFWCDNCYFTDTMGPDHSNCWRCDEEICGVVTSHVRNLHGDNITDNKLDDIEDEDDDAPIVPLVTPICKANLCKSCSDDHPTCNPANFTCGTCEKNYCHGCYGTWQDGDHPEGSHSGYHCDDCMGTGMVQRNVGNVMEWYFPVGPDR